MTDNNPDLLPCPFCGGMPVLEKTDRELLSKGYPAMVTINCRNEDCANNTWKHTPEQAIAAWNTRSQPQAQGNGELIEILKILVDIERRDNIGNPDQIATDKYREQAWARAYELLSRDNAEAQSSGGDR